MPLNDNPNAAKVVESRKDLPLRITLLVAFSIGLNIVGHFVAPLFSGLLFLDMVGTAFCALILGPWYAASVGAITNLAFYLFPTNDEALLNFAYVNAAGGLIWGYLASTILPIRGQPKPTVYRNLLLLSFAGALVVSPLSLLVLTRFKLELSQVVFPQNSHNEHVLRLLASVVHVQSGTVAKLVPFELVASLPDKALSICFAAYLAYYFFPKTWSADSESSVNSGYAAELLFFCGYLPSFLIVGLVGYAEFRAPRGHVHKILIDRQLALAAIPLFLLAVRCIFGWRPVVTGVPVRLDFFQIYRDVLVTTGGIVTVIVGAVLPHISATVAVSTALNDGLGLLAALGIFGAIPAAAATYYLQPRADKIVAPNGE